MGKFCDLNIRDDECWYTLTNCSTDDFLKIVEYKSWMFKSWKYGKERKYFVFSYISSGNPKIVKSQIGFAPVLIRYLEKLGFAVNGRELFRSKDIIIGKMMHSLWNHQKEAVDSWIKKGACGVIKIPTGGGKTTLSCKIIEAMHVRTIICVHTSDLLINVWLNTLVKQFGEGIKSRLGVVGGKLSRDDRRSMRLIDDVSYLANIKKDIVIATSQSLLHNLNDLCRQKFGLVVYDEAHHAPADQFKKVIERIRAPYRLGLSATLYRPDGMSPLIYGLLGDISYRISIKELVNLGILVEPIFNTIVINDEETQDNIKLCGLNKLDLVRYIKTKSVSSVVKKNYIIELVKSLVMNNKKFIMYTDFVNDNENIGIFTRDYYVDAINKIGIRVIGVSSEMSGSEREKVFDMLEKGNIDGLVFGKLGAEGVDIKRVEAIVCCNATKSTILFPQRVGRAMRSIKGDNKKFAYIYEVVLNTKKELEWSKTNFYEYNLENYTKETIMIN